MSNASSFPPSSISHDRGSNADSTASSDNVNLTPSSSCHSESDIRPYPQRNAPAFVPDGQLALAAFSSASSASSSSSAGCNPPPFVSFQSTTIAPSPPVQSAPSEDAAAIHDRSPVDTGASRGDAYSSLRISTNVAPSSSITSPSAYHRESPTGYTSLSPIRIPTPLNHKSSSSSIRLLTRTPSLKAALAQSIGSASGTNSVISSPMIAAMGDVTPLPSPLLSGESPGPWRRLAGSVSPPQHRSLLSSVGEDLPAMGAPVGVTKGPNTTAPSSRRKAYASLAEHDEANQPLPKPSQQAQQPQIPHTRNRSFSEYKPDPAAIPKRIVSVSGPHAKPEVQRPQMKREQNLAESRGLSPSVAKPPTPPPSESSRDSAEAASTSQYEYFEAFDRHDRKRRRWRSVRTVGQGTFSRVVLATSQMDQPKQTSADPPLDRKTLVAIKVCEHGPQGGASEERVEMSLKRELEIMQSIHHPSLVNLKAWNIEPTRAILVLTYCPGGDLFDVATAHRKLLTPPLLRRIFAELVGAVKYLHEQMIVHRDIKLENVLVHLTPSELADPSINWATYPYSVTALADLGLSRRIAEDEKLETRCGSEDYAAPEVIMGQPYDGRATDAWSLGVLLYALLESRLPFDPPPGMNDSHRMRSRKSHRIARGEWRWIEYGGDDGDHEANEARFKEKGLLDAMHITEGLLKRARSRWTLPQVSATPWVRDAISVEGGIRFREEVEGAEV
ncbi:kinase-like protein [Trichoderma citrinoviride]|uniref:Kinase-like protein n=1 Tax=Trichoderma citrinoviride TaxID=58853 RepID=A0A2T4B2F2_9HYPO|nr:kinase-like protein [Trichoderma citrinoviride]PTB63499.1 kinase-like protein [Trichoderma citrinoviride]